MSLILASVVGGTRAVSLIAGIGYDVIFQTMVKTGSNIVNTAYHLTERPDYPKAVSDCIYELDLTAKIALVNNYLKTTRDRLLPESALPINSSSPKQLVGNDEIIETLGLLDSMISGDTSVMNDLNINSSLVGIIYLQQSLVRIDTILLYIKRKFEEYKKRWFNWRSLNVKEDLEQLRLETKILEDRVNLISKLGPRKLQRPGAAAPLPQCHQLQNLSPTSPLAEGV